jgi:hypothetical protein
MCGNTVFELEDVDVTAGVGVCIVVGIFGIPTPTLTPLCRMGSRPK